MSGAEVLATTRLVLLDRHVGVAKPDELYLIALFRKHSELLALSGGALGLVVAAEALASVVNSHGASITH